MNFLAYNSIDPLSPNVSPFGVTWGTAAPSAGAGDNGDYYFRYHDGLESIYKKSGGVWNLIDTTSPFTSPASAVSTSDVNIAVAPASFDGYSASLNDRILLVNQTTASSNGLYIFNGVGNAMTRAPDFNAADHFVQGKEIFILGGTQYSNSKWVNTLAVATLETDPISFLLIRTRPQELLYEETVVGSAKSVFTISTFVFVADSKLVVQQNGVELVETTDWTRTVPNQITVSPAIPVNGVFKAKLNY